MMTLADQIAIEEVRTELAGRQSQQQQSRLRLLKIQQEQQTIEATMRTVETVIVGLVTKLADLEGEGNSHVA